MTIGIAASGPHAAKAIIAALAAVEAIGTGAIGGFVSLAAISGGVLHRAQTQTGGGRALFEGPTPPHFLEANLAVLMSSGPNRPAPWRNSHRAMRKLVSSPAIAFPMRQVKRARRSTRKFSP